MPRLRQGGLGVLLALLLGACGGPRETEGISVPPSDIQLPGELPDPIPSSELSATPVKIFENVKDHFLGSRAEPASVKAAASRFQSELEPNNNQETAQQLEFSGTFWGWVHPPLGDEQADEDWYRCTVELDDSAVLGVQLSGVKGIDLYLELWKQGLDGKGKKLVHVDAYGAGAAEKLDNWLLTNGSYFLLVGSKKSGKAFSWNIVDPYKLSFSLHPGSDRSELEPNNDMRKANRPALDADIQASLDFGDEDWFQFDYSALAPGATLDLELRPSKSLETYWSIVTPDRQELLSGVLKAGRSLCIPNLGVPQDLDSLYLRLRAVENLDHSASYEFRVSPSKPEAAAEREPNQTLDQASPTPEAPFELHGTIHDPEDRDLLLLPPSAGPLALSLEAGSTLAPRLELLAPDGGVLAQVKAGSAGEPIEIPALPWAADQGTLLRIRGAGEAGCNATWKLSARLVEAAQPMDLEPNDNPARPQEWPSMPGVLEGFLSFANDRDCFVVPAGLRLESPEAALRIMVGNSSDLGLELQVFTPDGQKPLESLKIPAGSEKVLLPKDGGRPLKGRVVFCVQAPKDPGARPRPEGYRLSLELADPDKALEGR